MKQKNKTIFHIVLLVFLTAFALWFSLHRDFDEVIGLLRELDPLLFLFTLGLGILYYALSGVNLHRIARCYKKDYTWREGMICAYGGAFFNGVIPLGGGQVAQTYLLKNQGLKVRESAGILWMDFIIFQAAVLLFVSGLWLFRFSYFYHVYGPWLLLVFWGFAVNGFVIAALYAMVRFPKLYIFLSTHIITFLHKIHILKDLEGSQLKWKEQLALFTEQITLMKNDKRLVLQLLGVQILRMGIYYSIPYFAGLALHLPIAVSQIYDLMVLSSFIHMLNALTPLPGDTGFTESCFIIIFSVVLPWNSASAVMLLWRLSTYHVILLIGAWLFVKVSGKRALLKFC